MDALELYYGFVDIFFYVHLFLFLCPILSLMFLVMVHLRTIHVLLNWDGNLESCSFRYGWSHGRTLGNLGGLVVLWISLSIGILILVVVRILRV